MTKLAPDLRGDVGRVVRLRKAGSGRFQLVTRGNRATWCVVAEPELSPEGEKYDPEQDRPPLWPRMGGA